MMLAVIQARMGSSRLPGKVLAEVSRRPMLVRQLERVARARLVDRVLVATTDRPEDDDVADAAEAAGVTVFRGPSDDVLERVWRAAGAVGAEHVVRLTADCPLSDPAVIDAVIARHVGENNELTSNFVDRRFPDGLDVEVARFEALTRARNEARDAYDREHVTPYLYRAANGFRIGSVVCERDLGHERWTVDYPEDLELVRRVFAAFRGHEAEFSMWDVIGLLEREPALRNINAVRRSAELVADE